MKMSFMERSKKTLKDISYKRKLIFSFLGLHILLFSILVIFKNFPISIKYTLFIFIIIIPFLLAILIFIDNLYFKKLIRFTWFKFLLYISSVIFIIFSNSYASKEINNIFEVSSTYLPITSIFLTHIYALDIITYFTSIIALIIIPLLITFCLPFGLYSWKSVKSIILPIFLLGIYLSFSQAPNNVIFKHKEEIIKEIAYRFDFNEKYYCKHFNNVQSVLFIGDNKVLVKYKILQNKKEFEVKECIINDSKSLNNVDKQ